MRITAGLLAAMGLAVAAWGQGLEEKARELETQLIAPCCWSQPVAQHYSREADEMRVEIRRLLAEGRTPAQVLDHYVSIYGERVLASPRASGFNLTAYLLPYLSLGAGALALFAIMKRLRARVPAAAASGQEPAAPDPKYAARLERELRDLE